MIIWVSETTCMHISVAKQTHRRESGGLMLFVIKRLEWKKRAKTEVSISDTMKNLPRRQMIAHSNYYCYYSLSCCSFCFCLVFFFFTLLSLCMMMFMPFLLLFFFSIWWRKRSKPCEHIYTHAQIPTLIPTDRHTHTHIDAVCIVITFQTFSRWFGCIDNVFRVYSWDSFLLRRVHSPLLTRSLSLSLSLTLSLVGVSMWLCVCDGLYVIKKFNTIK